MDNSKNVQNEHLGVNKMGKSIRKSPLKQPNFSNNAARQQPQPQPQVYNISKNDFRNIVQQLTASPSQEPLSRPPQHPQKPQSMRLQRIRPPPLSPMNRPQMPPPVLNNSFLRPFGAYAGGSHLSAAQFPPGNVFWTNSSESPILAYMQYLQTAMAGPSSRGNSGHPPLQLPIQSQNAAQSSAGNPTNSPPPGNVFWTNSSEAPISAYMQYLETAIAGPSPRGNSGQPPWQPPIQSQNAAQLSAGNPTNPPPPNLPTPTSQFLLPSPSFYSNLVSPLLSPGIGFSPLLSPNFSFSPLAQPPPSPVLFPLSPSGLFSFSSPKWREQ